MSIEKIPELLLNCLLTLNYDFDNSAYWVKFGKLKTNLERVNYVYEDLKRYNLFPKLVKERKNDATALQFRENGKKLYTLGIYKDALMNYTCGIQIAEKNKTLAQIYANRSACLLKLGLSKECIKDINRALKLDTLSDKKSKLVARRKEASSSKATPKKSYEKLSKTPATCIKVDTNPNFGRHIVASRDIQIGEIIHIEEPFACVLEQDFLTHCHECMEICYNLIPCGTCTRAAFCGEKCKKRAMDTYHKFECPLLTTLIEYGLKPSLLALKISLLSAQNEDYSKLEKLEAGTEKRTLKNLFLNAVVAAVLFELLRVYTEFKLDESFKETLLFQLQACSVNAIRIYESSPNLTQHKSDIFAVGLYPFTSLFNHSCCYNVEKTHHGATIVLRAVKTIKKGEQCCTTYGLEYDTTIKEFRQMYLNTAYFFTCKCRACEENWRSRNNNVLIFQESLMLELGIAPSEFTSSYKKILGGDVIEAEKFLETLISALKKCEQFEPWGNVLEIKKLMSICYRTLGNKKWI